MTAGTHILPYQATDLQEVVSVLAEAMPQDPISPARFTQQVLLDANFRAEGARVARVEGRIVGFCLAMARQVPLENAPPDGDRGYVTLIGVLPELRRQGIGSELLVGAEAYLCAQGRSVVMVSPYAPGYFIPGVDVAAYAGGLAFFFQHGYREVYRPIAMEAPLWEWSVPEWVLQNDRRLEAAGVRCEPYAPEWTLPLLEFAQREFQGDWVRVVRETMGRILQGEPAQRLWIAHEQGRVLGFAQHQGERFGPIGVAAAERGRGLGHQLMFRTLAAMREQGFRTAWFLWSDDATARRLYHAAGFQERRRFAVLRKEWSQ
jgi:ribosomal protein S18 acetylase RimI-like enzyme